MKKSNKSNNKKGFTLVELVIVVAVIAILSAILIPTIGTVIKDAKDAAVKTDLRTLITNEMIQRDSSGNIADNKEILAQYIVYVEDVETNVTKDSVGNVTNFKKIDRLFYWTGNEVTEESSADLTGKKQTVNGVKDTALTNEGSILYTVGTNYTWQALGNNYFWLQVKATSDSGETI